MPSDDGALEIGRGLSADAVAEVTWADASHRHASLHVHPRPLSRWIDRDIGFDPSDADVERGRTLGFAVAAMLPDRVRPQLPPQPPGAVVPPALPPGSEDLDIENGTGTGRRRGTGTEGGAHAHGAVDVVAAAAAGGDATGIGGGLALRILLDAHFAVIGSGGVRVGSDSSAQATPLILFVGAGLGWRAMGEDARFRFGFRLDGFGMRESLSRTGAGAQARWVPAADLLAEGILRMTQGAGVVLGVGAESAFGTTDVFVRGQKVSTIPPLRFIGVLGIEAAF
jgi:hypothetical protein